MSKHLDKSEVKNPDIVTQELQKGFKWSTEHSQLVISITIGLLVVGAGWSVYNWIDTNNEIKAQTKYYQAEKEYLAKKADFDKAENPPPPADKKEKKAPEKSTTQKATGDLEKDYGTAVANLIQVVNEHPKSKAGAMAALSLAQIYSEYNKGADAISVLEKVNAKDDVINAMITNKKATLWADAKDCTKAVPAWSEIINKKQASFLHNEARLKQALCFESMNEIAKAEENYNQIIANSKDSGISKTAEKYLRILKTK